MYDIPELERKWRIYKRNQIKKPLIIGASILATIGIISIITLTYFNSNKKEKYVASKAIHQNNTQNQKKAIVITKNNIMSSPKLSTTSNNIETIDISKAKIVTPDVPDEDVRMIGFDTKTKNTPDKNQDILIPSQKAKEIKELEHIKELEERFKTSQDPQDSLFLAKYYYKKGDYTKAIDWAINTNNIDGSIEDSWIIFAKAQAKMGHRVDAIKALQSYYDSTGSIRAKELLDKLRLGKPFD